MIRKFLKAVLTAQQWEKLRKIKTAIYGFLVQLWTALCKILPDRLLLFLRSNTKLIKKMDYQHGGIFLNIDSEVEYNIRLCSCAKEPETIEWIQTFFKEGDVFYDIGANVGAYALVAAEFFKGNVRVYAFEPSFMTFKELCTNIHLNNCQESIVALQVALSDRTAIDVLNYSNLTPGGALHALGESIDYKGDVFHPVFRQTVLSYTVDDLIKEFGLPVPNHIKIDVDGIELRIIKGARETLRNSVVKSVIVEVEEGDEESRRIREFLEDKGLKFHSKYRYVYGGDSGPFSKVYNYIFRR